jgi:hypothetical protein
MTTTPGERTKGWPMVTKGRDDSITTPLLHEARLVIADGRHVKFLTGPIPDVGSIECLGPGGVHSTHCQPHDRPRKGHFRLASLRALAVSYNQKRKDLRSAPWTRRGPQGGARMVQESRSAPGRAGPLIGEHGFLYHSGQARSGH